MHNTVLTLSALGKILSKRHIEIFFLFLTFHANRLQWNLKSSFVGKIRKISSVCRLLNKSRKWFTKTM